MTSRIRLLSSTALWTSLVVFAALHLTASSPSLAEEDAVCQLTNTYAVKAPPELCRTLGGVPSTTEVDVSDALYDIWNENNRTDRDKAYAAATAYLTSFPNGSRAEELRRWSAAYEKVMALNTPREVPWPPQTEVAQPPQTEVVKPPPTEVAEPPQPEVAQPPQTETAAVDAAAAELAAWQSIERSRNPADFHAFIERYPDGEFTPSARRRLATLAAIPGPQKAMGIDPQSQRLQVLNFGLARAWAGQTSFSSFFSPANGNLVLVDQSGAIMLDLVSPASSDDIVGALGKLVPTSIGKYSRSASDRDTWCMIVTTRSGKTKGAITFESSSAFVRKIQIGLPDTCPAP